MRVGAGPGETAVQELPPQETGPVPVEVSVAAPRFFGVTPPAAVLALAAASLALAIVLLVSGHVIVGGALLGVAVVLAVFFVGLARRLPDTPVSRLSSGAVGALRARAGFAIEALSVHSGARVELFRLRRELAELLAQRAECARVLGEAVYADDEEGSESARSRMAELDGLIAAKEEEMEQTAAGAMERIQRAQLHVQPTQIETPAAGARALSRAEPGAGARAGARAGSRAVGATGPRNRAGAEPSPEPAAAGGIAPPGRDARPTAEVSPNAHPPTLTGRRAPPGHCRLPRERRRHEPKTGDRLTSPGRPGQDRPRRAARAASWPPTSPRSTRRSATSRRRSAMSLRSLRRSSATWPCTRRSSTG